MPSWECCHAVMAPGRLQPSLPPSLILGFYFYIYSTARRVRPGAATNQFDRRVGNGVRSRRGFQALSRGLSIRLRDLKLLLGRLQTLDDSRIGGRQRSVPGPLFLTAGCQREWVGYLTAGSLAGMLILTLTGALTGSFSDGPWAASSLTQLLSPKLSDLLTYLLLKARI